MMVHIPWWGWVLAGALGVGLLWLLVGGAEAAGGAALATAVAAGFARSSRRAEAEAFEMEEAANRLEAEHIERAAERQRAAGAARDEAEAARRKALDDYWEGQGGHE